MSIVRLLSLCLLLPVCLPLLADPIFELQSRPAGLQVHIESEQSPLRVNQMHRWRIQVTDEQGAAVDGLAIEVEGGMPAHDHGLPTQPQVRAAEQPGLYWLEGMRFHMGGEWRLGLVLLHEGRRYRVAFELEL